MGMGWKEMKTAQTQAPAVVMDVVRELCGRKFRRENDRKKHKCLEERQKNVCEQRDATQCLQCQRWFRSRGAGCSQMYPGS